MEFDISQFNVSELKDCEILGLDNDGCIIQWDATGDTTGTPSPYNCGETPEEFGVEYMTETEKARCGLTPVFSP